jgi:hypothetical protein
MLPRAPQKRQERSEEQKAALILLFFRDAEQPRVSHGMVELDVGIAPLLPNHAGS